MTTPASPSPGTQLLSEEELERALRGVISNFPQHNAADGNAYYRITGRVVEAALAHIAALTAENARLVSQNDEWREAFDANHSVHCMREQQRLQQEIETLTASREEMRGRLKKIEALDITDEQFVGQGPALALKRLRMAVALSQQPEAQG